MGKSENAWVDLCKLGQVLFSPYQVSLAYVILSVGVGVGTRQAPRWQYPALVQQP